MENYSLFLYIIICRLLTNASGCTYRGAVYEHVIEENINELPNEIIKANLKVYDNKTILAAKTGAKIIVFPEYGITGYHESKNVMYNFLEIIPDVTNDSIINPCSDPSYETNDHLILHSLSCLAKNNKIFLVANLGELAIEEGIHSFRDLINITPCSNPNASKNTYHRTSMFGDLTMFMMKERSYFTQASKNKNLKLFPHHGIQKNILNTHEKSIKQYNTDIVFDSDGNLVAKYRKCHLCGEDNYDYPSKCQLVTFHTPFAGEFGIFTCFDINWKFPAVDIINKNNNFEAAEEGKRVLRNIVFPTMWPDILPFITAIGVQSAYSVRMNVNLLAANVHHTYKYGERGSGIYAGINGPLNYTYTPGPINGKLLISDIPCVPEDLQAPSANLRHFSKEEPITFENAWVNAERDHFLTPETSIYRRDNRDNLGFKDIVANSIIQEKIPLTPFDDSKALKDKVAYVVIPPPQNATDYHDIKIAHQCIGELCCTLKYQFARPPPSKDGKPPHSSKPDFGIMVLGAYDQLHPESVSWYLRICAFTQCPTQDPNSCGQPTLTSNARFSQFSLSGNFSGVNVDDGNDTTYVFPILLTDGALLPKSSQWKFKERNTIDAPKGFTDPILSAALWGRVFDKDL